MKARSRPRGRSSASEKWTLGGGGKAGGPFSDESSSRQSSSDKTLNQRRSLKFPSDVLRPERKLKRAEFKLEYFFLHNDKENYVNFINTKNETTYQNA